MIEPITDEELRDLRGMKPINWTTAHKKMILARLDIAEDERDALRAVCEPREGQFASAAELAVELAKVTKERDELREEIASLKSGQSTATLGTEMMDQYLKCVGDLKQERDKLRELLREVVRAQTQGPSFTEAHSEWTSIAMPSQTWKRIREAVKE